MPQLWTETIVTQYFWLFVILFAFYYLAVTIYIPQIANTIKARKTLGDSLDSESKEGQLTPTQRDLGPEVFVQGTNASLLPKKGGDLLSSILAPKLPTVKSNTTETLIKNISTVKTNWINKYA